MLSTIIFNTSVNPFTFINPFTVSAVTISTSERKEGGGGEEREREREREREIALTCLLPQSELHSQERERKNQFNL